jgi:sugar phosphate isomerase/epimerase
VSGPVRLGAITDEFSPNLAIAIEAMREAGLTGVELRVVNGRNILELADDEVDAARVAINAAGMTTVAIATPLLKCELPSGGPLDDRLPHDVFGSPFGIDDQPRLARRAFEIAERLGARLIRVFSYWRTKTPDNTFDAVASALRNLAEQAQRRGMTIGLENEFACNVGTGVELAQMLARVDHPGLQAIWDPANALILGEAAFPDGYSHIPPRRIAHVHVKDCNVTGFRPTWGLVGRMSVNWRDQIHALQRDGYDGWLHLETHWQGPHGDKLEASRLCAEALAELAGR